MQLKWIPSTMFLFICLFTVFPSSVQSAGSLEEKLGIRFGVGMTLTVDIFGRHGRIGEVSLGKDNVVRVHEEFNDIPRVMIETHYFFEPKTSFFGLVNRGQWGWGPFIGLQNGSESIVQAAGGGVLIGFRRGPGATDSFNVGLGAVVDTGVRVLGDGIKPNQPLKEGQELWFKKSSQWGLLILTSYSF